MTPSFAYQRMEVFCFSGDLLAGVIFIPTYYLSDYVVMNNDQLSKQRRIS
jgi:hypothetical protein